MRLKQQSHIEMFSSSMIVLTFLGLFAGFTVGISNGLQSRSKRSGLYHGPLAPINHDGTVAFTPDIQQAQIAHQLAFAAELQRLKEAETLAAAHPDLTSPKYSYGSNSGYNQAIPQQYYQQASLNIDGTVANTAEVQNAAAAQKAAFAAEYKRLQEAERLAAANPDFTSPSYSYGSYSKGSQSQQQALQYSQGNTYNYSPQFYTPAPLNKDGTVALTPEVQQARAAHQAAFAAEFQRLDEAARLAAAYPDLTSPQKGYTSYGKGYYNQNYANQYIHYSQQSQVLAAPQNSYSSAKSQYQGGHYTYNPLARIPAPLNPDGTVAHTAEYKAIAAAHRAEYARALQRNMHHGYYSSNQQSHSNKYNGHY
ncbi:uncharacterized protein [Halyomorpha halys]|uniref:uncharacterized protein n=1 Tax=Halyomorpha halys TaxID=286706 RepID=UPI0006D508A5|nr:uncharacterized protein LOC106685576 [Halyomorpha halys]